MLTQASSDQERLLAKLSGQATFLKLGLSTLQQEEFHEKIAEQMRRGVTAIRGSLRQLNWTDLEIFASDFEELLQLVSVAHIELTPEVASLIADSTHALEEAITGLQHGHSAPLDIQETREAILSALVEHVVTVKL